MESNQYCKQVKLIMLLPKAKCLVIENSDARKENKLPVIQILTAPELVDSLFQSIILHIQNYSYKF